MLHVLYVLNVLLSLLLGVALTSRCAYVGDWAHVVASWDLIRHENGAVLCQPWHLIAFVSRGVVCLLNNLEDVLATVIIRYRVHWFDLAAGARVLVVSVEAAVGRVFVRLVCD